MAEYSDKRPPEADPDGSATATDAEHGAPGQAPERGRGRGRSAYSNRDLTTGSINRNLWFLAWPQTVNSSLRVVDQLADLVWAGFVGSLAIAGLGVAQSYSGLAFMARMGMDVGMRAMVSRAIGMGDLRLAQHIVFQAATITGVYAILMALIGFFLTDFLLGLLGLSDAVVEQGAGYMRIHLMSQGVMGFQQLAGHSLSAAGDTMTPMRATIITRVSHLVLSPVLMFGLAGAPELGLPGVAVGNVIAHSLSLAMLLAVLFRGSSRLHLKLIDYRIDIPMLKRVLRIGGPASVTGMERAVAQLILILLVAPFGDVAVAAYSLTRRVEMFAHMGASGFGMASGVIVGQSLGAGKPERAKETIRKSLVFASLINAVLTVIIIAFPVLFLSLFTRDEAFLEVARKWVIIAAAGYVLLGMSQVFQQSLQTAGDTMTVMLITLGAMWGVEIPLAYFLTHSTDLGQFGVAWAMLASIAIRPVIFGPYFLSGRWLNARVFG